MSGAETATPMPATPTSTSTIPATSQATVELIAAQADDPKDGELFEYVILENQSPVAQELVGWRLVHQPSAETYIFPTVTLLPGEQLVVWSGAGTDDPAAGSLFWPATAPRWVAGDTAELHTPAGQVVSALPVVSPDGSEE